MITVTLRKTPIKKGKMLSLYLDFYPPVKRDDGTSTRREYLRLYIHVNPKDTLERTHNKETLNLANIVRARRQLELQAAAYNIVSSTKKNADFLAYFDKLAIGHMGSNTYGSYQSALGHLKDYTKGNLTFNTINESFIEGFKTYLLKTVSRNSAGLYFSKLITVINKAVKENYFSLNPARNVKRISKQETKREFLTAQELQKLIDTDCPNEETKRAFIFACFVGVRFSDAKKITWQDIQGNEKEGFSLRFRQTKTKGVESLPITINVLNFLGERKNDTEKLFKLAAPTNVIEHIKTWVETAGINKKITFHCSRHTFAIQQLSQGATIYTVSKLLGHKDIKTTQIYAKMVDQTKTDAMNKLSSGFDLPNTNK